VSKLVTSASYRTLTITIPSLRGGYVFYHDAEALSRQSLGRVATKENELE
jgi:hypothetical protein